MANSMGGEENGSWLKLLEIERRIGSRFRIRREKQRKCDPRHAGVGRVPGILWEKWDNDAWQGLACWLMSNDQALVRFQCISMKLSRVPPIARPLTQNSSTCSTQPKIRALAIFWWTCRSSWRLGISRSGSCCHQNRSRR